LTPLLRRDFAEVKQVRLTPLIGLINGWTWIMIGFRAAHPAEKKKAAR
jgi:hypothetical protein